MSAVVDIVKVIKDVLTHDCFRCGEAVALPLRFPSIRPSLHPGERDLVSTVLCAVEMKSSGKFCVYMRLTHPIFIRFSLRAVVISFLHPLTRSCALRIRPASMIPQTHVRAHTPTHTRTNKHPHTRILARTFAYYTSSLSQELRVPGDGVRSDSGIKMEILKSLSSLTKNCGKQMNQFMGELLPVVWTLLTESVRLFAFVPEPASVFLFVCACLIV